jgi:CRP-like cAMP-binding protein
MVDLIEQLQKSQIFQGLEVADLEALIAVMERKSYAKGEVLFERGDVGESMVQIISGSIRVYTEDVQGNEITLVVRREGEVVGELTLLDHLPRSASAAANEALDVLVLDREHFLNFLKDRPTVGFQMMQTLTGRIRYTTSYLQKMMDWITRLSSGDYEAALEELSNQGEEGDAGIQKMIGAFIEMVRRVKDRETELQNQLDQRDSDATE